MWQFKYSLARDCEPKYIKPKDLLETIRVDLKRWSKTQDGRNYKKFYKKYKEAK